MVQLGVTALQALPDPCCPSASCWPATVHSRCSHNLLKHTQWLIHPHSCLCAWCRYESQMQSQRLRLVSDHEMRLEQHEAERKDERRRFEDTIERLRQASQPPSGFVPCLSMREQLHAVTTVASRH